MESENLQNTLVLEEYRQISPELLQKFIGEYGKPIALL